MSTAFDRSKEFSNDKLGKLRAAVSGVIPADATVITSGSYARREASASSDLDYFSVLPGDRPEPDPPDPQWLKPLDQAIVAIVPKSAAKDGAFNKAVEYSNDMLHNIGGSNDTNEKITRRVLLLLEGDWLYQPEKFFGLRRAILERYIQDTITDHQLALFLLNDIIRYYRTMAVDFEFKTFEVGKPWAIRNIKLMFSRKLLYASGLFSVAMTADAAYAEKIRRLEELFNLTVIDRTVALCGAAPMEKVLSSYNNFLEKLENASFRDHLNSLPKTARNDEQFRALKNEGHHFTRHILALFENTFGSV